MFLNPGINKLFVSRHKILGPIGTEPEIYRLITDKLSLLLTNQRQFITFIDQSEGFILMTTIWTNEKMPLEDKCHGF